MSKCEHRMGCLTGVYSKSWKNPPPCIKKNTPIRDRECLEWKECYTTRLPRKKNFRRYEAKSVTGHGWFVLVRKDRELPRLVIDRTDHLGTARALYFWPEISFRRLHKIAKERYGIK